MLDTFSRKLVGWEVYGSKSAEQASQLFQKSCRHQGLAGDALVLHADDGAP